MNLFPRRPRHYYDPPASLADITRNVKVEVSEHRAPTDESVRLLREMEKAAEDKVFARFTVGGNMLKGKAQLWEEMASNTVKIRIAFTLNDEKHDWTVETDRFDWHDRKKVAEIVHAELAKRLARLLMESVPHLL
jgi:hypothetical protein